MTILKRITEDCTYYYLDGYHGEIARVDMRRRDGIGTRPLTTIFGRQWGFKSRSEAEGYIERAFDYCDFLEGKC